jgi:hypothetical protein
MPEAPEIVRESFAPEELIRRLEELRQRYSQGALTAAQFNDVLSMFQFNDEFGHLWTPGARTSGWYRWDRTQWTAAEPPRSLALANPRVTGSAAWHTTTEAAFAPGPQPEVTAHAPTATESASSLQCTKCKKIYASGTFCVACGGKLDAHVAPSAPAAGACAVCGARLTPGGKFCAGCGSAASAAAPVAAPQPLRCPNPACGRLASPGQKFCHGCGTGLRPAAPRS